MSTRWLPSEAMAIASPSQASALKTTNLSTKELARDFPSQSFFVGCGMGSNDCCGIGATPNYPTR